MSGLTLSKEETSNIYHFGIYNASFSISLGVYAEGKKGSKEAMNVI